MSLFQGEQQSKNKEFNYLYAQGGSREGPTNKGLQMVGFGKKLRELQNPEWEPYYINYKMMKKKLKIYVRAKGETQGEGKTIRKEFLTMLDWQIEKIVLFLLEQQGHLAARLAGLSEERELVKESGDASRVGDCIEAYRDVGTDLLELLYFVEINATGLRKILKKYDKRVAYRLTDYYVASRSNHPYSQLQQVLRHVGIGAMVGALSHGLAELQNQTKSMYDEPAGFSLKEPIIDAIKAAEERLTNSTSFLQFIGTHALIVSEGELPTIEAEIISEQYNFMSLVLNLANTFLYMVNTYIIVPSADKYASSLGAAPTACGVIIGSMAVAQLVSSVYFSAWSNKSYYRPLIFSSVVLFLGNVLYALAYDMDSLPVLIIGRIFCGLGSARAVNRRYISDWVPLKKRLQASAAFVSASALGMATGPALAGFFDVDKTFFRLTLNAKTLPGWVMAVCWCLYLVFLWMGFKEPSREQVTEENVQSSTVGNEDSCRIIVSHGQSEGILAQPLLESNKYESENDSDQEQESSEDPEDSNKPAQSLVEAYRLLTTPVKVQLLIYFMLKYAMEVLLSESSVVTDFYFDWTTRPVAIFLALLGLTVLPVNILVGSYISNMYEDRQILVASELLTCLGVIISFVGPLQYSVAQYVSGALITFVAAEVLEGVNLSLLSKVMSSRLARGTYNNGLLSTEAGTLARVIADGTITLAGYFGTKLLVNLTLAPTLFLGIVSLVATFYSYNALF